MAKRSRWNLTFTDTNGRPVKLADYFQKGRPVILQLGYFNCPQLCDVVSQKFMESVKGVPLEMGKDYSVLYVSIDPDEKWELGRAKKRNYVEEFGKPGAADGWNFLVGNDLKVKDGKTAIALLADSVGFGYNKLEGKEEFSHPPMLVVLTGEGKISRYFYGFQFPSDTLKTGIEEASQGKIGPYVQQILVALCYHYDEYSGKYSLALHAADAGRRAFYGSGGRCVARHAVAPRRPPRQTTDRDFVTYGNAYAFDPGRRHIPDAHPSLQRLP
ncbi:MAG: SCO family protein [Tepidisphaeraceae bacterium]